MNRSMRFLAGGLIALGFAAQALAQAWPARPIRLVVNFAAGGSTDVIARSAAQGLAQAIGGAEVAQSDFLQPTDDPNTPDDESAVKRLVVVIGLDRASGATPSTTAP